MIFEKDYKYLYFRIILLALSVFLFIFIGSKIAYQSYEMNCSIVSVIITTISVNTIFNYFMIYEIKRENDFIKFKNIYNLSIKTICIKDLVEKKIFYLSVPSKILFLFSLLGNKYEKTIWIKLKTIPSNKFSFNGQILSHNGIKKFSILIKVNCFRIL